MRLALTLATAVILTACSGETASSQTTSQTSTPPAPGVTPEPAQGVATDPGGIYRRSDPANGRLTITPEGGQWRIAIVAAGLPAGGGTAADCELVAVGPLEGDQILGRLVPFEGETGGLTAADIGETPGTILVTLADDGSALVTEEGASSRHCGMGSDLSGTYVAEN